MHPKPLQLKTPPDPRGSGAVQILIQWPRTVIGGWADWIISMAGSDPIQKATGSAVGWRISSRVRLMCNQLHKETRSWNAVRSFRLNWPKAESRHREGATGHVEGCSGCRGAR
jgi:hypothetical protein